MNIESPRFMIQDKETKSIGSVKGSLHSVLFDPLELRARVLCSKSGLPYEILKSSSTFVAAII